MKISIALCTFNGAEYLAQQLTSLFIQSHRPFEIIASDDGSTDETLSILDEFQQRNTIPIEIYTHNTNFGARKNFEFAIGRCSGDVIFLCDQDDIWLPKKIEECVQVFENDRTVKGVFCNGYLMKETGEISKQTIWDSIGFTSTVRSLVNKENILAYELVNGNIVTGTTLAFRREIIDRILPFFLPHNFWHDHWIGLQLASMKGLVFLDKPLIHYRLHSRQLVGFNKEAIPEILWPLKTGQEKDENGILTMRLVHSMFRFKLLAPEFARHCPESIFHVTITGNYLKRHLRILKTGWLRQTSGFLPRKIKLVKHWLKGGEYLDITLHDVLTI